MRTPRTTIDVEIISVSNLAEGIRRYDFVRCDRALFPDASPGAHVTLHMRDDLARAYSLIVAGARLQTYAIAVKYEPDGAGGSRFMHDQVTKGSQLSIDLPRNDFPMAADPAPSLFVAGGIGITPIWPMIAECERLSRPWKLFYAAKSRSQAAFVEELERSADVQICLSDSRTARLDLEAIIGNAPLDAHLYCCGSAGMIANFQAAARGRPPSQVHVESFAPAPIPEHRQAITVTLARTGRTVLVPPHKTIAEAMLQAGVRVKISCRQGNCGTCEVDVIEGVPDHRDEILTEGERAANKTMMICCSWSKSDRLVLDL